MVIINTPARSLKLGFERWGLGTVGCEAKVLGCGAKVLGCEAKVLGCEAKILGCEAKVLGCEAFFRNATS